MPAALMNWGSGLGSLEAWVPAPVGWCGQKPEFLDSPFQFAGPPINPGGSIPVGEVRVGRGETESWGGRGRTREKDGGEMEVRKGMKGELLRVCWQEVPEQESRGLAGVLTFHSRRMMSPSSSSPAPTATSTSHSSISAGSSSTSSESMSTENWRA